jgi:hypothetical protein
MHSKSSGASEHLPHFAFGAEVCGRGITSQEQTDMVEYGHVLPKPGQEKAWFDALPKPLQEYMKKLGAKSESFTLGDR